VRRLALLSAAVLLPLSLGGDASASGEMPALRRHLSRASDEALFACACPGAVSFCREWKEKWAKDVPDPKVRNQTVRECVIDFMSSVAGRPWP
jgi:hypothetical protein